MLRLKNIVLIFAVGFLAYFYQTKVIRGPVYNSDKDLNGKTVLITGGNAGIGKSAAILFAKLGARVIIASRNIKKSKQACDEIIKESNNYNVYSMQLDLGSFDSIKDFAQEFKSRENRLDYLINNAGVLGIRGIHKSGFSRIFTINYVGPFLLTHLLLELMTSSNEESRIINVASAAHILSPSFDPNFAKEGCESYVCDFQQYGFSKLCNILFTKELQRRLSNTKVTTYSLHPGIVSTEIGRNFSASLSLIDIGKYVASFFLRSPYYGAQTIMYCALDDDITKHKGEYFSDCRLAKAQLQDNSDDDALQLWKISQKVVRNYLTSISKV